MKTRIHVSLLTTIALGAVLSLLCGQLWAQGGSLSDPFEGAGDNNCSSQALAPDAVSAAGFRNLSFCDDFNSISTIDVSGTGAPGFKWYTRVPRGWSHRSQEQTLPSAYSVSHSVLTVTSTGNTEGWALSTRDPITGNGQAWNFGYFEARIRFDPTLGPKAAWYPTFWSVSSYFVQYHSDELRPELDFFEAYTPPGSDGRQGNRGVYQGEFLGTLHQWSRNWNGSTLDYYNSNSSQPTTEDWSKWHVIGCLWVPGKVTWYLGGKAMMSQEYSATAPPNPLPHFRPGEKTNFTGFFDVLDTQTMQVVVGSAPGWPEYVDWVRVWEK